MRASLRVKIKLILLAGDLVVLMLCLAAGTYIRLSDFESLNDQYSTAAFLCLLIYPLCLYLSRSYEVQPEASSAENLRRPFLGWLIAVTVCSFLFYFAPDVRFGRGIFAIANILLVFALLGWRLGVFLRLRRRSLAILLMGNSAAVETAQQLIREFSPLSQTQVWQPGPEPEGTPDHLNPHGEQPGEDEFDLLVLAGHSVDPSTLRMAAALRLRGGIGLESTALVLGVRRAATRPLPRRTLGGHRRGFPFAQRNELSRSSSAWWTSASPFGDWSKFTPS